MRRDTGRAMSQENVELVRRLYAEGPLVGLALSPEDEEAVLDRLFRDYYDEQFEIRMPAAYPEGEQVLRGRHGMSQLLAMLRDTWTQFRCLSALLPKAVRAASRPSVERPISGPFVTVACRPFRSTWIVRRPSKPWGCRSRRCRK